MHTIAIVILNWNGSQMLRTYLPTVIGWSSDNPVYVADNGSTDNSLAMLAAEFPKVRVIPLDRNYGFAEGYNRALARVDAKYAVLLNSDVQVTPFWLDHLLAYLESHPRVAACQPKICSMDRLDDFEYAGAAGGFLDRFGYPYCRGRIFGTVETDEGQYDQDVPVLWASGAALCIRLDVYREVGGLDGRFFAHMEEIDLCWRLWTRGYGVACVTRSRVFHVGGGTLHKENPQKTYLNFRNNLLMLFKNLPDGKLRKVMAVRYVLDRLAALHFLLSGQAANARAVMRARRDFRKLRTEFAASRAENLEHVARCGTAAPLSRLCILWQYYVRGRHKYSQLPKGKEKR